VAARAEAWAKDSWIAGIAGSNPAGGMTLVLVSVVFSGRGLCVGLITLS